MISTTELSAQTGYSTSTIRALARDGLIPAISDGSRWLFGEDVVEQLASMAEEAEDGSEELEAELEALYEADEEADEDEEDEEYEGDA